MDTSTSVASTEDSFIGSGTQFDSPLSEIEARVGRLARAVLLALGLAVGLAVVAGAGLGDADSGSASAVDGGRLGGDFPAFYAAGSIVRSGDGGSLYDPARQEIEQVELGLDGYLAFAYPPHVAAAYAPLSLLNFRTAYLFHTILMAAAFVASIEILSKPVPILRRWRWPILAAGFTFYPLFTAVGGGQNAPLTLLLLAVTWRALDEDRGALAGIAAGLLLYRPQYALPLIGLLLLARQRKAVVWAMVVGVATWSATAVFLGADWVAAWFGEVVPFVERDADVNASNSVSMLGFLQAAWGADERPAVVVGAIGAAAVVVTLMWLWSQPERFSLANRMGAFAIGVLLISPHTMFYDASLMILAGTAILACADSSEEQRSVDGAVKTLALVWAASLLHIAADGFGATPLALIVFICFGAFVWRTLSMSNTRTRSIDSSPTGAT
jgi:hypothetical protein